MAGAALLKRRRGSRATGAAVGLSLQPAASPPAGQGEPRSAPGDRLKPPQPACRPAGLQASTPQAPGRSPKAPRPTAAHSRPQPPTSFLK
jgi:hypothetical protein